MDMDTSESPRRKAKAAVKKRPAEGVSESRASSSDATPESVSHDTVVTGHPSREERVRALRRFRARAAVTALLFAASIYGLFLDTSIRPDPFTDKPGFLIWLAYPHPHNALAKMPVVPIGARGSFTFRPLHTGWINSPYYPTLPGEEQADAPGKTAALSWLRAITRASAEEPSKDAPEARKDAPAEPAAQEQPSPEQSLREQYLQLRPVGDARPRVLHAQCVQKIQDKPQTCWLAGDGDQPLRRSVDGGESWAAEGDLTEPVAFVDFINSNSGFATSSLSRTWKTEDGGQKWYQLTDKQAIHILGGGTVSIFAKNKNFNNENTVDDKYLPFDIHLEYKTRDRNWFLSKSNGVIRVNLPSGGISDINLKTESNFRDIYFINEGQIGWVSSGWNDGNEEGERPAIFQTTKGGEKPEDWERLSYREFPAPWALYGALPLLLFAFYGAAVAYREIPDEADLSEGIEDIGWSDRPIGWNDPDVLDLKPTAKALSRFLRNRDTEPPLTIAVSGAWGSGKSSLMNLVAKDLHRAGTRTVLFNAWHHQKEDHLLAALLVNIREQAIPPVWQLSGLIFRARLLGLRMGRQLVGFGIAAALVVAAWMLLAAVPDMSGSVTKTIESWLALLKTPSGLDTTEFLGGLFGVGTIGATLVLIVKVLAQVFAFTDPAKLMASATQKARVTNFSEQLSFRHRFACEFAEVCKALRYGSHAGLVIMIDDLDRCRPNNAVEILEAINFLSSAGRCFIFLGVAKDKVVKAVSGELKIEESEAERYLEKLVNIEVFIPAATAEGSLLLSAPPERNQASRWPHRLRSALRFAPDTLLPGALALIVLMAVMLALPARNTDSETVKPEQGAINPAGQVDAAGSVPEPADAPQAEAVPVQSAPVVSPDELTANHPWTAYLIIGFVFLAILLGLLRRSTNAGPRIVEDSAAFGKALGIWHPVIFNANPMPRGIKRHQNRVRFQAMRLRPIAPEEDWLDRLFSKWSRRSNERSVRSTPHFSDSKLVAIAALDPVEDSSSIAGIRDPLSIGVDNGAHSAALREHYKKFPGDWPFEERDFAAYRGL